MQVFWRKGYLGASLSDFTDAKGINRPSLYAAFGNQKSLFRKVLGRYLKGPSVYLSEALREPTARAVERVLHGVVDLLTDPGTPTTCMYGAIFLRGRSVAIRIRAAQRVAGFEELRARLRRAVTEGDLLSARMWTRWRTSCRRSTLV
jgi:AcrR family transcriptional regulator